MQTLIDTLISLGGTLAIMPLIMAYIAGWQDTKKVLHLSSKWARALAASVAFALLADSLSLIQQIGRK